MKIFWHAVLLLVQEAVEKFATTGQKIHTIASKADKFLVVDRGALSHMSDMLGAALTLEVGRQPVLAMCRGCAPCVAQWQPYSSSTATHGMWQQFTESVRLLGSSLDDHHQ